MRIVFMGTPDFAVPSLEHLLLNKHEVVAVYTQPDRPAGRGRSLVASPVKMAALSWNLPVVQPVSLKGEEAVTLLAGFHPDAIVVAAYGQILPQTVLSLPRFGCINVHPSLLPRYRGASPVASAILAGDDFTGVSIMLLDSGLDTGPVLARAAVGILPQDDTGSLTAKLSRMAAGLLQEVLVNWFTGRIVPQPQNEADATCCGRITKEEGEIDWHLPTADIWRRVRAFNPWPGCYTGWRGRQLKVLEAALLPERGTFFRCLPSGGCDEYRIRFRCYTEKEPEFDIKEFDRLKQEGAVTAGKAVGLNTGDTPFGVCTGDGILGIGEVQLEGKRAMSAAEFLRGQRDFIGTVLPSS